MEAYHRMICDKRGLDCEYYILRKLMDSAEDILTDVDANPPKGHAPGTVPDADFVLSFWYYPRASALSSMGFCFFQLASHVQSMNDPEAANAFWAESGDYYEKAAMRYPQDDELSPYLYKIDFEAQWHRGLPLRKALSTCAVIRASVTKAEKIWQHNTFWPRLVSHLAQVQRFEINALTGLMDGRYMYYGYTIVVYWVV